MATELSKLEPWRFCTICDPESERSFSVERAYIKHLSSQRHLRKTNRPLDTFECPDCSKHFSRESEIHRHLINGRCSGTPVSRLISRPTTTSSKKHVLSVSPNGVPGKLHRTDMFTMDATVGSPRLFASKATVGHDKVQFMRRHSRTDAQTFVNRPLQRLVEDALPPRRAIIQVHGTTSLTSLLLHTQRQTGASIPWLYRRSSSMRASYPAHQPLAHPRVRMGLRHWDPVLMKLLTLSEACQLLLRRIPNHTICLWHQWNRTRTLTISNGFPTL
jgi:hypothetical protein